MQDFNKLLLRQIKKHLGPSLVIDEKMTSFLNAVNESYVHYENDKALVERAMELSSGELYSTNEKLRQEGLRQNIVLAKLKESFLALEEKHDTFKGFTHEDMISVTDKLVKQIDIWKKAEKKLKESESNLSALVENTEDIICSFDIGLNLIAFNSSFIKIYGKINNNKTPKIGMNLTDLLEGKQLLKWNKWLNKVVKGSKFSIEKKYYINGHPNFFEISINTILESGTPAGVTIFSRNVTERKNNELKANELLKELTLVNSELRSFAYIVSHDLKAPLRAIGSLANWISMDYADKFDEDGKEQMKLLLGRVSRMYELIEGILEYSKVGRIKESRKMVDLNVLLKKNVIDLLLPPNHIEITIDSELPAIQFSEIRIAQVFQNLISNAIKFIENKEGEINIGCQSRENFWVFYVKDNGCGIEEKNFSKIFQIFQTLKPRDEVENTGIGLTIVKKIIDLNGGKIWIESEKDKGSTFFFSVPKVIDIASN